jgi:hypothetical protein
MILRVDETTKVKPSLIREEEITSVSLLSLVGKNQEVEELLNRGIFVRV